MPQRWFYVPSALLALIVVSSILAARGESRADDNDGEPSTSPVASQSASSTPQASPVGSPSPGIDPNGPPLQRRNRGPQLGPNDVLAWPPVIVQAQVQALNNLTTDQLRTLRLANDPLNLPPGLPGLTIWDMNFIHGHVDAILRSRGVAPPQRQYY